MRMPVFNRSRPLLVGAVLVWSAACGRADTEAEPAAAEPIAVTAITVTQADVTERLEAGGTVTAAERVSVSSRILAPVIDVRVRAGDRVRAGQVLVVLDDRDLAAQVRQASSSSAAAKQSVIAARADLAAAVADEKLATAWHGRVSTLRTRNAASAQEFDEAEARRAAAIARVAAADARLAQLTAGLEASRAMADAATTTRSFSALAAPFDGVVSERLVDPGAMASPGMPLLRLDAAGAARVTAQVDESRMPFVRPGTQVTVVVGAGASASGPLELEGVVIEAARTADANQQAFSVTVGLPPGADVRPGAFARVRFAGAGRPAVTVPVRAIRRQGQIATVFVIADGVARLRLIQTVALDESRAEVVAGLAAGEVVVDNPPPALTDGRRVAASGGVGR
jgi:HlyD family secretion protein